MHGAVSLLLAGFMCLLPFLIPYHQLPLRSFYPEWLAAALGLVAFAAALASPHVSAIALPAPARWMIGFAAFLAVCAIARDTAYPQMSLWAVVYVLYAVLMIWLGACLVNATSLEQTAGVLAVCILAGALVNAAAGVIQFYGRAVWLEDLVADLRGIRAYGNIAQPNLYANYLALGQAALLFLWARGRISGVATWCAATLLGWAIALSDSRAALLYVLWFAALGAFSARGQREGDHEGDHEGDMRRLRRATFALAAALLAAYVAVPWFNRAFGLGPAGTDEHVLNALGDIRWQAWMLALRIFASAPIAGVGIGEFAGAAFEAGLPREMADKFEVWTSPHNQVLQLMAETGAIGTLLVIAGVGVGCWQAWRRHCAALQPATWWIIAAVGVELIHSLLEFPLWSAHFLGVTALLMGALAGVPAQPLRGAVLHRLVSAATCAVLAGILVLGLRDYWRLDLTRATGAGSTLAGAAATQDARTLRQLGHGLLAPMAEFWLCVGAPLNRDELALKLGWSERAMRYIPANAIVGRRAIFLALDGREDEAVRLVDRLAHPTSEARQKSMMLLQLTEGADQAVIAPLIARISR